MGNEGIASEKIRTRMPSHFLSLALLLPSVCYAFTPNPLPTPWTDKVDLQNPWPEYPRPQLVRESWQSLNGPWEYSICGPEDDQVEEEGVVIVPYCLESMLSNVSHGLQDGQVLTYKKTVHVPEDWVGKYIALNFEAVDYEAEVFVEGIKIGAHKGGFDSFTVHFSLLDPLERDVLIEVKVKDPTTGEAIPVGKQLLNNEDGHSLIYYTPCSGIWQTVWMEPVNSCYLSGTGLITDIDLGTLDMIVDIQTFSDVPCPTHLYRLAIFDEGDLLAEISDEIPDDVWNISLALPMQKITLWSPDTPKLYNYTLEIVDAQGIGMDSVLGYFGIRKIEIRKVGNFERFFLNNELLPFQIGPLDQGFWPDGIYSPPTEEAMLWDLQQTKALGFNMVRKHVKVEPRRWYYATDTMGLLVAGLPSNIQPLYNKHARIGRCTKPV